MNVTLQTLPTYRIAYMRQIGPYGVNNAQLMQKLKTWAVTQDLLDASSIILGIAHDDPALTPADKCRYDCGIVLAADYNLDKRINETTFPGGEYAVVLLEHTAEAINTAWQQIFSTWLPDSAYQLDTRPIFERYMGASNADVTIEPATCEICVPIVKL
ncbi:MAG: GyrI-like domain-containing protein [Deinococcota bacterium]